MKKPFILFLLLGRIAILNAQTTQCKTIAGTIGSGNFEQLILSSYSPSSGNPNWHEALSFAWTCNAIGHPTCNYRTLMKYDLSSIPQNAVISSAKLKLFAETSGQDNGNAGSPMYGAANTSLLQKVTSAWNNPNTGWNNQPNIDAITQKTLSQSVSNTQNYEIDVADFVQSWVAEPASNYGMLLRLQAENYYNSMIFFGGTTSVPEGYRPTLEICYTVPVNCISAVLKGTIGSGNFEQLILSSYSPSSGNPNWHEALSFAWTCNAIGYSTCNYRTLMKYDLSSIPKNAIINSAKLKLFAETNGQDNGNAGNPMYGTANTSLLQKVTSAWNNPNTGWNNQPNIDAITQKTLSQSVSNTQNYEIDVADFVQSWVADPASNYGMLLRLQAENYYNSMIFFGGTTSVPEDYRPTLEICYTAETILPSALKNFSAKMSKGSATLSWTILNEQNTRSLQVLRSNDGVNFDLAASIPPKKNSEINAYQYIDYQIPIDADKIFYRLVMIDNNGIKKSSNIVTLNISEKNLQLSISPIPTKNHITLDYNSANESIGAVKISDMAGRITFNKNYRIKKGIGLISIHDLKLATGIYFISIEINGKIETRKFIIQN